MPAIPPPGMSIFGIVDDAVVCPSSGLFDNGHGYILSRYFYQGGGLFRVNADGSVTAIPDADVAADLICWHPVDGGGMLYKGPAVPQEEIHLGCPTTNGWIQIYTTRPDGMPADDAGANGTFLAGYKVTYDSIRRYGEGLRQQVPAGSAIPGDQAGYYAPSVTAVTAPTGSLTGITLRPAGGASFFRFGRAESLLLWPETGPVPFVGPTFTGTGAGTGGAFPAPDTGGGSAFACDITRSVTVGYKVTAVLVTRTAGVAAYTDGVSQSYTVAVMPVTTEPLLVSSRAFHPPAYNWSWQGHPNNSGGDGIYRGVVWWFSTETVTWHKFPGPSGLGYSFTVDTVFGPDGVGAPLTYTWEPVPGATGYTVFEHWGRPGETNAALQWSGLKTFPGATGTTEAWGQRVTQAALAAQSVYAADDQNANGATGQMTVYAVVPAGGNGGSCPYAMPRPPVMGKGLGQACTSGAFGALCEYDETTDYSEVVGTDACPTPYDPPYQSVGGNLHPVDYYNGPFVVFPGPPPPSCALFPVFAGSGPPPPPPGSLGAAPALLGRPYPHYARAEAGLSSDRMSTTGILFRRADKAIPLLLGGSLWDTVGPDVAVTAMAGDNSPSLCVDSRGLLQMIFARPSAGALLTRSDDDGQNWTPPALAIPGGTHPQIASAGGHTLCAAVTTVGSGTGAVHSITGALRGPGDAVFQAPFVFQTSTDGTTFTNMSVADDSFGIAFAAEGPDRMGLHVLMAGETATSDWWSGDGGKSWTRVPLS